MLGLLCSEYMPTAIKTTMNFSPAFHTKLKQVADEKRKPMGVFIEECLTPMIDDLQARKRRAVFDGLFQLEGMVKEGTPDASATIDEYLYGWGSSPTQREEHA